MKYKVICVDYHEEFNDESCFETDALDSERAILNYLHYLEYETDSFIGGEYPDSYIFKTKDKNGKIETASVFTEFNPDFYVWMK